jgi:hypothetical protein
MGTILLLVAVGVIVYWYVIKPYLADKAKNDDDFTGGNV